MIQLSRNYSLPEREEQIIPIKVIAVGGAGSNALDRIVLDGMDKPISSPLNTDAQSLASSVAAEQGAIGTLDYARTRHRRRSRARIQCRAGISRRNPPGADRGAA